MNFHVFSNITVLLIIMSIAACSAVQPNEQAVSSVTAATSDGTAANEPAALSEQDISPENWRHLSSTTGDLPVPDNFPEQQTAALVLDVDNDGLNDLVVGARRASPAMVWYKREVDGWTRYLIDDATLNIEAGGAFHDIDGDNDLDIVMGADSRGNEVWWWENPAPTFEPDTAWNRYEIKNAGEDKHHDQMFGDFDGDGQAELVFWNQFGEALVLADIPADPTIEPWPQTEIFSWLESDNKKYEGFAQADINGDGKIDIIGGGLWFEHEGGTDYTAHTIAEDRDFTRSAAGQLVAGGRPEVVIGPGDDIGRLLWYEWDGDSWEGTDLLGFDVDHGHSLDIVDINGDGHLDIFCAEMRLNSDNDDAKMWIFLGDSQGNFATTVIAEGYGNHESRVADLDGDGDLDIMGKPYNWETPRLDVWLNNGTAPDPDNPLGNWERHLIDDARPWRALFITAGDMNGDNQQDIITGGWWYQNPGNTAGDWTRNTIGSPLNNMAAVEDFDGDGALDVLGTGGEGSSSNDTFVWARNDGSGSFTILDNIEAGDGDFLQGVAVERFAPEAPLQVALSWHASGRGVQMLTVPADPGSETWPWARVSEVSQDEGLSAGDIDRDGDSDLLLGTRWLRNDGDSWSDVVLSSASGAPDRNRLADINGDGRLDAVVGYEAISSPGKLAWYEQGETATDIWNEHLIATIIGPMSVDVADMDDDGDLDVVAGEHNTQDPDSATLYVFENADGSGTEWIKHVVYVGDEHHDGARLTDIDGDGDLDIISIGWTQDRVVLYENVYEVPKSDDPTDPIDPTDPADEQTTIALPFVQGGSATASDEPSTSLEERVTADLQTLYRFEEGAGQTVRDVSNIGPALDLTIADEDAVQWETDSLLFTSPTIIQSIEPASGLIDAVSQNNELTIEAWIAPASLTQDGPARIVTISRGANQRNITLGQGLWNDQPSTLYDARLRTTATDENGRPSLSSTADSLNTELTHVVYTYDTNGIARLYIDGEEQTSAEIGGDLSNWDSSYQLALGNELDGQRPWLGSFHLVACYSRALNSSEVQQNFRAGSD